MLPRVFVMALTTLPLALRRLRGGTRGESAAEPSGPSEEDKELVGG